MLHSMREDGSGWLGTGDDDAGAAAFGFGEDQLAQALTKGGGLGLAKVIAAGLAAKSAAAANNAANADLTKDAGHALTASRVRSSCLSCAPRCWHLRSSLLSRFRQQSCTAHLLGHAGPRFRKRGQQTENFVERRIGLLHVRIQQSLLHVDSRDPADAHASSGAASGRSANSNSVSAA